jgi:hypothetical protein
MMPTSSSSVSQAAPWASSAKTLSAQGATRRRAGGFAPGSSAAGSIVWLVGLAGKCRGHGASSVGLKAHAGTQARAQAVSRGYLKRDALPSVLDLAGPLLAHQAFTESGSGT